MHISVSEVMDDASTTGTLSAQFDMPRLPCPNAALMLTDFNHCICLEMHTHESYFTAEYIKRKCCIKLFCTFFFSIPYHR
jgi:hypothetical protein